MNNFIRRSKWSRVDYTAFWFSVLVSMYIIFDQQIGAIEGKLNPVVTGITLTEVIQHDPTHTDIYGTFEILRPECNFVRIDWILEGGNRSVPVSITFNDGAKARNEGHQNFGPWAINIPAIQIQNTNAHVIHKCPFRPWYTVTKLYP